MCFQDNFWDLVDGITLLEMLEVLEGGSYHFHHLADEDYNSCPEWLHERAEWQGEKQMEMERGN